MICDVTDPLTGERYTRDPRNIAKKAEEYLKTTGIADTAYFGPELEFFIFDDVRFDQGQNSGYYFVDSDEAYWNTGRDEEPRPANLGYKVALQGGLLPGAPVRPAPGHPLGDDARRSRAWASRSRSTTTRSPPPARPRSTCASAR